MSILTAFISHQIWLQRNASHEVNELEPFIQQMRDEVKSQVLAFGDESRTRGRLQAMLKDLEDILYAISSGWEERLQQDLQKLTEYETDWTTDTLSGNVNASFTAPSPEQVWSAIKFNPLQLEGKPVDFQDMLTSWRDTEINRLVTGVKSGFVQGMTTRDIVRQVVGPGGLADVSNRNAATVVRTAINHVSTESKNLVYQKNDDIVEGYELVVTLDKRTSSICRNLPHGKVYDIGKGPLPPLHPNCFLGDTEVSTCSAVSRIFKRTYKGVIVYVTTKSGRTLSVTPNHPIMTSTGWVPAGELNLGSKLVCGDNRAVSIHHQKDNVVAKFSEVFGAANVASDPASISTSPTTAKDFHGDGANGEVEIVFVNGFSWDKVKTCLDKQIIDQDLPMATGTDDSFPGLGSTDKLGVVRLSSSDSLMGCGGEQGALFGRAAGHSGGHSLTSTPYYDPAILEDTLDWVLRNADDLANVDWANTVGVELDDVIDLAFGEADFCGHVYNLENENNWYLANGIIAHNCRTTTAPVISSEFDFLDVGGKRAARGADGGTQVDADTSYYEFLQMQPAWFQDEALGPVRGNIFRNSGMTAEEFRAASVDGFGRPLTLREMAENDKRVAKFLSGNS